MSLMLYKPKNSINIETVCILRAYIVPNWVIAFKCMCFYATRQCCLRTYALLSMRFFMFPNLLQSTNLSYWMVEDYKFTGYKISLRIILF